LEQTNNFIKNPALEYEEAASLVSFLTVTGMYVLLLVIGENII